MPRWAFLHRLCIVPVGVVVLLCNAHGREQRLLYFLHICLACFGVLVLYRSPGFDLSFSLNRD